MSKHVAADSNWATDCNWATNHGQEQAGMVTAIGQLIVARSDINWATNRSKEQKIEGGWGQFK